MRFITAMWTTLKTNDWVRIGGGAALALVAGVMLGGAMQPNLTEDFIGPHTLVPGGGERATNIGAQASVADYAGPVPEYVVGTDWTRPREVTLASEPEAPPVEDAPEVTIYTSETSGVAAREPARIVRSTWRDDVREPAVYPSARGGVIYETDLPAPPPTPDDAEAGYLDHDAG